MCSEYKNYKYTPLKTLVSILIILKSKNYVILRSSQLHPLENASLATERDRYNQNDMSVSLYPTLRKQSI